MTAWDTWTLLPSMRMDNPETSNTCTGQPHFWVSVTKALSGDFLKTCLGHNVQSVLCPAIFHHKAWLVWLLWLLCSLLWPLYAQLGTPCSFQRGPEDCGPWARFSKALKLITRQLTCLCLFLKTNKQTEFGSIYKTDPSVKENKPVRCDRLLCFALDV